MGCVRDSSGKSRLYLAMVSRGAERIVRVAQRGIDAPWCVLSDNALLSDDASCVARVQDVFAEVFAEV
jgi:hypothetical protein